MKVAQYTKAIAALLSAVLAFLATPSADWRTGLADAIGVLMVYLFPNAPKPPAL